MATLARHVKGSKAIGGPGEYSRYNKQGTKIHSIRNRYLELNIDLDDTSISRPWTADGEEILIQYFYEGYTLKGMSKMLNRTWPDIASRLMKLAMEKRIDSGCWGVRARGWLPEGGLYEGVEWR